MNADAQVISLLRNQVAGIVLGSSFLLVGIGALITAALRQRRQFGLVAWFGAFSTLYGLRMLAQAPAAFALLPPSAWPYRGYVIAIITYVIILPARFFWLHLTKGTLRRFIQL